MRPLLALGSWIALLTVCGCTPTFARAPTTPTAEDLAFGPPEDLVPSGVREDPPVELRLYPGDLVELRLTSAETEEVPGLVVDERGVLHVPLGGDVDVRDVGLSEAERRVEAAMQQYDRTVRVSLVLSEPLGHQASVIGAVAEPGRFPVTPGLRLADLLAAAGGPMRSEDDGLALTTADLSGAHLVRDGQTLPVSVSLAIQGDPLHNVRIRPGDMLYVPGELYRLVTVLGQVDAPQMFGFRPGMRLTQALAIAGGVTRDGNWGDVRIIRGDHEHPRVYGSSVADIVDGRAPDVVLAPGDIVYVASAGHADLRDVMNSINFFLSAALTGATATIPAVILSSQPTIITTPSP